MDSSTVLRNLAEIARLNKITVEEGVEIVSFDTWVLNDNIVPSCFFLLLHGTPTPLLYVPHGYILYIL